MFASILEEITGGYAAESRSIWHQMTDKYMIEDLNVAPVVTILSNDNWVEYTLRYIVDYKKRRTTKDLICELLLTRIDETQGRIKLGSATFEITAAPDLDVKVHKADENHS